MKTTGLMQGNVICRMNRSGPVHMPITLFPYKILKVGLFEVEVCQLHENPAFIETHDTIRNQDISSIMLTRDMLIAMGFKTKAGEFVNYRIKADNNCYIGFELWDSKHYMATLRDVNGGGIGKTIITVHELQNRIYSLTEELIIPAPKAK